MANKIRTKISYIVHVILFYCFRLYPIRNNKIFVSNFVGKGFSDSPRYICEELLKNSKKYDIVWAVNALNDSMPTGIRRVRMGSIRYIYEMCTARIWIDNCRKAYYARKRKGQFYIQTWHGSIALKKCEKDALESLSQGYILDALNDSKMVDVFTSSSKWTTEFFKNSFWYDGEIIECGLPRTDEFFKSPDAAIAEVYKFYNLNPEVHLILYAPTFRGNGGIENYLSDYVKIIDAAERKWGGEWKLLVRLHPNMQKKQSEIKYGNKILNGSVFGEINKLIVSCDLLITDYSSCMFDAMLIKKSVILFACDIQAYMEDRGSYFELEELPFPLAENEDELISKIILFSESDYYNKIQTFSDELGLIEDGHASERICALIEDIVYSS